MKSGWYFPFGAIILDHSVDVDQWIIKTLVNNQMTYKDKLSRAQNLQRKKEPWRETTLLLWVTSATPWNAWISLQVRSAPSAPFHSIITSGSFLWRGVSTSILPVRPFRNKLRSFETRSDDTLWRVWSDFISTTVWGLAMFGIWNINEVWYNNNEVWRTVMWNRRQGLCLRGFYRIQRNFVQTFLKAKSDY